MDIVDDSSAKRFRLLMDTFRLLNFVHFTTHIGGHTLDLVLTRVKDKIQPLSTEPCDSISDHVPVIFKIDLPKLPVEVKTITYRDTKHLDIDA